MIDLSHFPRFKQLNHKTILGIDYGFKVIGTALFKVGIDPFVLMHEKIIYQNTDQSLRDLEKIINEESVDVIVFGLPFFTDGKPSDHTEKTKAVGLELQKKCPSIEFFFQDETLTTKAAEDRMKNSAQFNFKVDPTQIDCVAATIILEDFIRS